jgi:hypothetical protein
LLSPASDRPVARALRAGREESKNLQMLKSLHTRQNFKGWAVRFVGRNTSSFWKDDIRAEAMTQEGIPRLHTWKEVATDSIRLTVLTQGPRWGCGGAEAGTRWAV